MNENKLYYWLSLSGVSDRKLNTLLNIYSPSEIWSELPSSPKLREFLGEKGCDTLLRFRYESFIDRELGKINDLKIRIVTRASDEFPKALLQKEVCPPMLLYYKGDLKVADTKCVAIVGTRACSSYGKEVAEKFAHGLAENGVTVVSGLATGIDSYAHAQCVKSGGKTIAVLGGGFNNITPTSNIRLSEEIEYGGGLLLTQYPFDRAPTKYTFPERNRLIAGLSLGTVVIEAGEKSGALITADFALEQGREVFAVPGNITSSKSKGPNRLICEGARPVVCVEDILTELRLNIAKKENSAVLSLDFFEEKLYTLLQDGDKSIDDLIELSQMHPSEVNATILGMEVKGIIIRRANTYGIR